MVIEVWWGVVSRSVLLRHPSCYAMTYVTPQQSEEDVAAPLEPEKQRTALQTAVLMFALCVSFSSHL